MGFLMFAGLVGTMAYETYFAKNEIRAIISDEVVKPTQIIDKDKKIVETNFKRICKRCKTKLNKNDEPIYENHYKPCVAYLEYQGFQKPVTNHFKKIYLDKYNNKHKKKDLNIELKHNDLLRLHYDTLDEHQTKIYRQWHTGNTKAKCEKMMSNILWSSLVNNYNIVKDGYQNVEVWVVSSTPSILKQIDKIYNEVCHKEKIIKNER